MGIDELRVALADQALQNEPLSRHTTFGIGGPADLFVVARSLPELRRCIGLAWAHQVPYFLLGGGANVLVADRGVRGLVIQNHCDGVEMCPEEEGRWLATAESGAELRLVAHRAIEHGLAGLEWAVDVPGTVGGAVVGNAGAYGAYTSDNLQGAVVLSPESGERWWPRSELALDYRASIFKKTEKQAGFSPVILSVVFMLQEDDPEAIRQRAADYRRRRLDRQPAGRSAGSVFKRTDQYPAGFLIESAGLKGARVGGAIVSNMHANFIINEGTATAQDVCELMKRIQDTVYARFKIALEPEIELVGDW